jgi:sarcosine oxidase gamma subunit
VGTAEVAADGEALRRAAVEGALRHAKALTLKPPPASEDEVEVAPEERPALLRAAFAAAFPSEAGGVASGAAGKKAARKEPEKEQPGTSPEELEARLLAAATVSPDAFTALAGERAQHARDALVEAGVDQGRLFLTQGGQRAAKEKGSRVYFEVK